MAFVWINVILQLGVKGFVVKALEHEPSDFVELLRVLSVTTLQFVLFLLDLPLEPDSLPAQQPGDFASRDVLFS